MTVSLSRNILFRARERAARRRRRRRKEHRMKTIHALNGCDRYSPQVKSSPRKVRNASSRDGEKKRRRKREEREGKKGRGRQRAKSLFTEIGRAHV